MTLSRANAVILLIVALLAPSAFATATQHSTTPKRASSLSPAHTASAHTASAHPASAHATPAHAASAHPTSAHATTSRSRPGKRTAIPRGKRLHGQQAIEPERVTEIQTALIHAHYLSKDADGHWDTTTEAAMQKYQADHGWQTKLMPDSRALKALGLGPDYSNAINAKNSSFTSPPPISTIPPSVAAGFTEGSGVVH